MKNKEKKIKMNQISQKINSEKEAINYYWNNNFSSPKNNENEIVVPASAVKMALIDTNEISTSSCASCSSIEQKEETIKKSMIMLIVLRNQLLKLHQFL